MSRSLLPAEDRRKVRRYLLHLIVKPRTLNICGEARFTLGEVARIIKTASRRSLVEKPAS